jgi:hypothetical protein
MSRRAIFHESDLSRLLRAARKAGLEVARVEIDKDGKIVLVTGAPAAGDTKGANEWDSVLKQ